MHEFQLRFNWSLLLRIQLAIFQHCFRSWVGASYLNQGCLDYLCLYASLGLNELISCWAYQCTWWHIHISFINLVFMTFTCNKWKQLSDSIDVFIEFSQVKSQITMHCQLPVRIVYTLQFIIQCIFSQPALEARSAKLALCHRWPSFDDKRPTMWSFGIVLYSSWANTGVIGDLRHLIAYVTLRCSTTQWIVAAVCVSLCFGVI